MEDWRDNCNCSKCTKKRDECKRCPRGERGPRGCRGERGPTGPCCIGPTGSQGVTGPQGFTGPQGLTGQTGFQGSTGTQGPTGPRSVSGAIITYNSGYPAVPIAVNGSDPYAIGNNGVGQQGVIYTFGAQDPNAELGSVVNPLGLNMEFTGVQNGIHSNLSFSVPRDGVISDMSFAFQSSADTTLTLNFPGQGAVYIRTQLYKEQPILPGIFVPIASTLIEIPIPTDPIIGLATLKLIVGQVVRNHKISLNEPVSRDDRLLMFSNLRLEGIIPDNAASITGFFSAAVCIQ